MTTNRKANVKVRACALENGVYLWQVAKALGISEYKLSRMLRVELDADAKEKLCEIIEDIAGG